MLKTITSTANTVGSLEYKGLWNAATNTPTLVSSVGTQGDYYVVSVAGTTNLDGVTTWDEGDWAIFNGSVWQLFQGGQDGVFATLTVSGEIIANGGIALGDNDKATFGNGDDLQIFHDGSNSYITDVGTGDLKIRSNKIRMEAPDSQNMIIVTEDAGVQAFYNGTVRLSVNNTGIDVTGTIASPPIIRINNSGGTWTVGNETGRLQFYITDISGSGAREVASIRSTTNQGGTTTDGTLEFWTSPYDTVAKKSMEIDGRTGDISFYEDTGTTPKFFWDASAESLGIGTTSPDGIFEATGGRSYVRGSNENFTLGVGRGGQTSNYFIGATNSSSPDLLFSNNSGTTNVVFTHGGNVGIGATPNQILTLDKASGDVFARFDKSGAIKGLIGVADSAGAGSSGSAQGDMIVRGQTRLLLDTAGSTAVTIDNSQNVGIGCTPSAILHSNAIAPTYTDASTVFFGSTTNNAAHNGIMLSSYGNALGGSVGSNLTYANSVTPSQTNTGRSSGEIQFSNVTGSGVTSDIKFGGYVKGSTSYTERARLTGDGNFLVGTTDTTLYDNTSGSGINLNASGRIDVTRGDVCLNLNRNTSDGSIIEFRQSGTAVGSIASTFGTDIHVGTGDTRLRFVDQNDYIRPANSDGSSRNGLTDLGASTARFKDLYLSGGVYLGGTGAANKLDDYETGTWTPTVNGDATGVIQSETIGGYYTKVGNQVTLYFNFRVTTNFTSSYIGGLPFQVDHPSMSSSWLAGGATLGNSSNTVLAGLQNATSTIRLYENGNLLSPHAPNTSVDYYRFQFSYRTDS